MFSLFHIGLAIVHLAIAIATYRLYQRKRGSGLLILLLVALGLCYDNLIVGTGSLIGIGDTLEAMSIPRYIIHAVFTPLLLITGYQISDQAGLAWIKRKQSHTILMFVVGVLIVAGVAQNFINSDLLPACHNDTLRYAERITTSQMCDNFTYPESTTEQRGMPPVASILTILILLGMGAGIWRKSGWKWLFVGALLMFICAAIPASIVGLWVGNTGEAILLASLLMSIYRFNATETDSFVAVAAT